MSESLQELFDIMPQVGKVEWIGIRLQKRIPPTMVIEVEANPESGLIGDHYNGQSGNRQVTLIQQEHLDTVASILNVDTIDPGLTRRNIVVSGINLLALKDRTFQIGEVVLGMTSMCYPCSRMEANLGPGGYNAMRGHGGINARVIEGGKIRQGDTVKLIL